MYLQTLDFAVIFVFIASQLLGRYEQEDVTMTLLMTRDLTYQKVTATPSPD